MATTQDLAYRVTVNDAQLDRLIGKTVALNQAIVGTTHAAQALDVQLRAQGRRMTEIGRFFTRNLTQPLLLIGAGMVKLGYDFEKSFGKIESLAGASAKEMKAFRKEVFELGRTTPTSVTELADALYFIRSSGFQGAQAMNILTASNKAAVAGLGTVKEVADVATSAMNAYAKEGLTAAQSTDALLAAVRVGKGEPAELARSIGRVIPLAAQMGVSFKEAAGNIAALTLQGLSADLAVTGLRAILTTFTRGLPITQKGLATLGISFTKLQDEIGRGDRGFLRSMIVLRNEVDKFDTSGGQLAKNTLRAFSQEGEEGAAAMLKLQKAAGNTGATLLSQLFPNVRALTAFLSLTSNEGRKAAQVVDEVVGKSVGETEVANLKAMNQEWQQMRLALNKARTEFTELGSSFLPTVTKLANLVATLASTFNKLPGPVKEIAIQLGVVFGLIGPVLVGYGLLLRGTSVLAIKRIKQGRLVTAGIKEEQAAVTGLTASTVKEGEAAGIAARTTVKGADLATAAYTRQSAAVRILTAQELDRMRIGARAAAFGTIPIKGGYVRPAIHGGGGTPGLPGQFYMTAVTRDAGKFTKALGGARVAAVALGGALKTALSFTWPLIAIEVAYQTYSNWDKVAPAIVRATDAAKGYAAEAAKAAPGGEAAAKGGSFIPQGLKDFATRAFLGPFYTAAESRTESLKKEAKAVNNYSREVKQLAANWSITNEQAVEVLRRLGKTPEEMVQLLGLNEGAKELAKNFGISEDALQGVLDRIHATPAELAQMVGLTQKLAGAARAAKDAFNKAFDRLAGDLGTAFDAASEAIYKAFDRRADDILERYDEVTDQLVENMKVTVKSMGKTFTIKAGGKTPAEREVDALEKAEDLRKRNRELFDAGLALREAQALGDPAAIREAQRRIEDARGQSKEANLAKRAEAERKAADKALDAREKAIREGREGGRESLEDSLAKQRTALEAERALEKRHLEDRLASLVDQLLKHRITLTVFRTKLRGLMGKYGVTAAEGGKLIGRAFATQITESMTGLEDVFHDFDAFFKTKQESLAKSAEDAQKRIAEANRKHRQDILKTKRAIEAATTAMTNSYGGLLTGVQGATGGATGPITGAVNFPLPGKPTGYTTRGTGPGMGTHNQRDWQSRNAIDIFAQPHTRVLSPVDGTVTNVSGGPGTRHVGTKILIGYGVTIVGQNNTFYIAHLENVTVSKGQAIRRGAIIGYVDPAAGHIHFAVKKGDPKSIFLAPPAGTKTPAKAPAKAPVTHRAPQGTTASRELQSLGGVGSTVAGSLGPGGGGVSVGGTGGFVGDVGTLGLGQMPGIGSLPKWLRPEARTSIKDFAKRMVLGSRLAWRVSHGGRPESAKERAAARLRPLRTTLSAAQRARLGPNGVQGYLQWLAGVQSRAYQSGIVKTHASGPDTLGTAGMTGNVGPITINVYAADNPKRTAIAVREELQKTSKRNARQTRGRTANQVIGAR